MVIPVIMNIDNPVKLGFFCNVQFCVTFDTFRQGLSGIFLHLDVKKFPKVGEPFDQLRRVVFVELDVGEVHL